MRKVLMILGVAAVVGAALVPVGADARAGGARSSAARFAPPMHGIDMRTRLNRELAQRLRCHRIARANGSAPRWRCG